MSTKNNITLNDYQTSKYLIDSHNYTFKQMQYLYLPVEEMPNPRTNGIYKLVEKAESINDWLNEEELLEKWGLWCFEQNR